MDGLSVCFNNMLADRKAKTTACDINATSFISSVEAFKDPLHVFFRYTNTIITNLHKHMLSIYHIHAGSNTSILFSILNRILYKVLQYLPHLFLIGKHND